MTRRSETKYIVVHCSATPPQMDIGRREIREWHLAKGWVDVGYSIILRRNGLIELGRHPDDIGAHVRGFNSISASICLVGGLYHDRTEASDDFYGLFTKEQENALEDALRFYMALYPSAEVLGHRDLSPDVNRDGRITKVDWVKSCPGFGVRGWMKTKGLA